MASARNLRGPAGRRDRRPGAPRRPARAGSGVRGASGDAQAPQVAVSRRHESERSVPAAINGAISALLGSAVGLTVLAAVALVSWVLAAGRSSVGAMLDFVGYTWLAGHLAPVQTELGLVWAPPLILTAACFWLASRVARLSVRRSGLGDGADLVRMVVAAGLIYGVIGLLVAAVTATSGAAVPEWAAFLGCAAVGGAGVWFGAAGAGGMLHGWTSRIPAYLRTDLRSAGRAMALLLVAAALVVIGSLVLHGGAAADMLASLRAGAAGTVVVLLLSLIYLPTVAVWAVGYSASVPVSLGADAAVAPWGDSGTGTLPALPLFAAVPTGPPNWLLALAVLPVAAGAYAAIVREGPRPSSMLRRLGGVARLAGLCALLALVAGQLAHISLGGRLAPLGPNPLLLSGAVGLLVFVGACLGDAAVGVRSPQPATDEVTTPDRGLVGVDS